MTEISMTLAEPFEPANERIRQDLLQLVGSYDDDHKSRVVVEASVGTESREVYIELRAKHPNEFGVRKSLGILTISERELEALVAVLKALNPSHA